MNRFPIIALLALCFTEYTAVAGGIGPMYVRTVRLEDIPLKKGERIAAIEVTVAHACVRSVTVPLDWRAEVSWPDASEGTRVTAEAGHAIAWLDDGEEFGDFLTLAFYKEWGGHDQFEKERDITAKVIIEDEQPPRTNDVPAKCIRVSAPGPEQNSEGE